LPLGFFVVLSLVYTFPLPLHLSDATLSPALGLNYAVIANAALVAEAREEGRGILESPRIWFPSGYPIHEGLLPSLLVFLLGAGGDLLRGLNLSLLLSFVLAGWGAYLLAYEVTGSRPGSLVAGIYFGFSPQHYGNLGIYPVFHLQWLPLFLWALFRYCRSGRPAWLTLVAGFFAAAALSSWYFAVFLVLAAGLWLATYGWSSGNFRRTAWAATAIGVGVLAVAPLNPVALLGKDGLASGGFRFVIDGSADLLSFFIPHALHWLFLGWSQQIQADWTGNPSLQMNYLGTLSLLLCFVGYFRWRQERWLRGWLAVTAVGFLVLALGPFLAVDGLRGFDVRQPSSHLEAVRLPFYWLADVFPFRVTRAVSRYSFMTTLCLSVFLASGVAALTARLGRPVRNALVAAGVGIVVVVEFLPVWPAATAAPAAPSEFYSRLAQQTGGGSVIELPFRPSAYRILYYSTLHRHNVIGGAVDKPFVRFEAQARRRPLLRRLALASSPEPRPEVFADVFGSRWEEFARAEAADLHIDYAVIHLVDENLLSFGDYYVAEPLATDIEHQLPPWFQQVYEDRLVRVFRVTGLPERWVYPILGQAWGKLEHHGKYVARPLLGDRATLEVRASHPGVGRVDLDLSLILVAERTLQISFNGEPVLTTRLSRRRDSGEVHTVTLDGLSLEAGTNLIELRTPEPVPSVAEVYRGNDHRRIALLLSRLDVAYLGSELGN
jgi:hypothetical protein